MSQSLTLVAVLDVGKVEAVWGTDVRSTDCRVVRVTNKPPHVVDADEALSGRHHHARHSTHL